MYVVDYQLYVIKIAPIEDNWRHVAFVTAEGFEPLYFVIFYYFLKTNKTLYLKYLHIIKK